VWRCDYAGAGKSFGDDYVRDHARYEQEEAKRRTRWRHFCTSPRLAFLGAYPCRRAAAGLAQHASYSLSSSLESKAKKKNLRIPKKKNQISKNLSNMYMYSGVEKAR
jgi:hypothetical protein